MGKKKHQHQNDEKKNQENTEDISQDVVEEDKDTSQETNEKDNTDEQEAKEETKEDIQKKYEQLNDKYIRAYSDFENSKKRLEKDKYSAIDYAVENFSKDLLEVVDNMSLALKANENTDIKSEDMLKNLTQGIDLTLKKLQKVLEKYGITKIDASGEFDPNMHNAISQVDDENHKTNEIVEVFQDGYKIKDRVLRASMVSIAK